MNGTRRDVSHGELIAGEYGKDPNTGTWYCCAPNGMLGNLSKHQVTEHEDGTISVAPSILIGWAGQLDADQWHGFIERGVWRSA